MTSTRSAVISRYLCVSAWTIGSDSNLMILSIQVACFFDGESVPCELSFVFPV
jgi:hypothetical protein